MPTIVIQPTHTLIGRDTGHQEEKEVHTWDEVCDEPVVQWAVGILSDAGTTRYNWGGRFITEEPKIVDFSRGKERTAVATLQGFTEEQIGEIGVRLGEQ